MSDSLSDVIQKSPFSILHGDYWVIRSAECSTMQRAFAVIKDEIETTAIICCDSGILPAEMLDARGPFKCIRFEVSKPFAAVGFLSSIAGCMAKIDIPILIVSTFSFDYALIRASDENVAVHALLATGFKRAFE